MTFMRRVLAPAMLVSAAVGCHGGASPTRWAQIAGTYRATVSGTRVISPQSATVAVSQDGARVAAHIDGFGNLTCTATPVGSAPRLTACSVSLDACTVQRTFPVMTSDDGTSLSFAVTTRETECTGQSGGTLLFGAVLTPL